MKRTKFFFHVAAGAAAFLALTASAWADVPVVFSSAVTGTVWRVCGNYLDALTATPGSAACSSSVLGQIVASGSEGTFTTTSIDFYTTSGTSTLGNFLLNNNQPTANAGISPTNDIGMTGLSDLMSNCTANTGPTLTVGTTTCYSTAIHITGLANVFQTGVKYTLTHDDGVYLSESAGGGSINSISPTSSIGSSWTQGATTGTFDLWYMGTNENPEDLILTSSSAVPEPASILLFGGLLVGLAGALKRRFA